MEKRLNHIILFFIALLGFVFANGSSFAQIRDTSLTKVPIHLPDRLYKEISREDVMPIDSINKKNNKFVSFIISTFYNKATIAENPNLNPDTLIDVYNGMRIDTIYYFREQLGRTSDAANNFNKFATNIGRALHITTKEKIIARNLLFKQGDIFNDEKMELSEYMLRETGYLTDAKIMPVALSDSTVAIIIITHDKLSVGASLDYRSRLDSRVSLYDRNFTGRGNKLEISEYFNVKKKDPFTALGINHVFTNLFGTFTSLKTEAAYGEDRYMINVALNRDFVETGDFAGGIGYTRKKWMENYAIIDTLYHTDREYEFAWFGKSFQTGAMHNHLYITAGYERTKFFDRPFTTKYFNPYFHDRQNMLAAIGVYKERFYKTNMINGFGYTEDVPYGYKIETIGGYFWGSYKNTSYIGSKLSIGHKLRLGYFNASAEVSGFLGDAYNYHRTIAKFDLFYFTNLISMRRNYYLRMFLRLGYTGGFKMLYGEREQIGLNGVYSIRGIGMRDNYGVTRSYLSQENVYFAPWKVLGFKFALFSYLDMGTLGYETNPFKNKYYGTIGMGVRLRNDNLIFNTIEIRLSAMLNRNPNVTNNWQNIDTPSKLRAGRFIPTSPKISVYE
ncbi:MAG: hypothetical protein RR277_04960 [Rikenellaceae bacterium]